MKHIARVSTLVLVAVFVGYLGHVFYDNDAASTLNPANVPTFTTSNFIITYSSPMVQGNCVDRTLSALSILERHHPAMDRVKVAVSDSHCQPVLMSLDDCTYLKLSNGSVYESTSDFDKDTELVFVSPEIFRGAAKYYRPTITLSELLEYQKNVTGPDED